MFDSSPGTKILNMKRSIVTPTLKYRAVVTLSPRQDVNKEADRLYRLNFVSTEKIKVREHSRDMYQITYAVSDPLERETLFIIKPLKNATVQPKPDPE